MSYMVPQPGEVPGPGELPQPGEFPGPGELPIREFSWSREPGEGKLNQLQKETSNFI